MGLSDPAKFGLTYNEVVRHIEDGTWRVFYINWKREEKRKRILKEKNYLCPGCKKQIKNPDLWLKNGARCKSCDLIRKKRVALGKVYERKKKYVRSFCSVCRKWKGKTHQIGNIKICTTCLAKTGEK